MKISGALTTMLETAEKTIKNIDDQVTAAGTVVGDIRAVTKPLAAKSEALVASVTESAEQLSQGARGGAAAAAGVRPAGTARSRSC